MGSGSAPRQEQFTRVPRFLMVELLRRTPSPWRGICTIAARRPLAALEGILRCFISIGPLQLCSSERVRRLRSPRRLSLRPAPARRKAPPKATSFRPTSRRRRCRSTISRPFPRPATIGRRDTGPGTITIIIGSLELGSNRRKRDYCGRLATGLSSAACTPSGPAIGANASDSTVGFVTGSAIPAPATKAGAGTMGASSTIPR